MTTHTPPALPINDYCTVKDAARYFKVQIWKLQKAIKNGLIPYYTFFTKRRLVRLSEVAAVIEASRQGGQS